MSTKRRNVYLACFAFHFALVGLVCLHETLWLLERRLTIAPVAFGRVWGILDKIPEILLEGDSADRGALRQALATYTNASGIEVGYGYFAPNVPETHALVFECHYSDGRVDYQVPMVRGEEAQLRLTSLIEQIARTDFAPWREELIKRLARSTWQRHPDAMTVRAFFGAITPPTAAEYGAGKRERTFDCLYVYDFGRADSETAPVQP